MGGLDGVGGGARDAQLQDIANAAAAEFADRLEDERRTLAISAAALSAARAEVRRLKYVGGCPRVLDGCPVGWAASGVATCTPPTDYGGPCGAVDIRPPKERSLLLHVAHPFLASRV